MADKKRTSQKYGRRAADKTQTSISLSANLLERARLAAEQEGRSLSNYIEQVLKQKLPAEETKETE